MEDRSYQPSVSARPAEAKPPVNRGAPDLLEASGDIQVEVGDGGAPGVGGLAMSHWEGQSWTVWTSVQGTNLVGHKCSGHFQFYPLPTDFLGVPQEETSTQGGPPADRCVAVG